MIIKSLNFESLKAAYKCLILNIAVPLLCILSVTEDVKSQDVAVLIQGKVIDVENQLPIAQASVIIGRRDSSFLDYSVTKSNGSYLIEARLLPGTYVLSISHISFASQWYLIEVEEKDKLNIIKNFFLESSKQILREVTIKKKGNGAIERNDTIDFKADSFRTQETRKIEDLIRNIEGFSIDANGRISYRGKNISTVLLDGDDLTQGQYQLVTKNLSADVVDRLQVIDNFNNNSVRGALTKSKEAAINIQIKADKKDRLSGETTVGLSLQQRHEVDVNLLHLTKKFKTIAFINSNNIAKDPTGVLNYEWSGISTGLLKRNAFETALQNGIGIVNTGIISSPQVSKEYAIDNNNIFAAPLFHFRLSKALKMAIKLYVTKDDLQFSGGNNSFFKISEAQQWILNGQQISEQSKMLLASGINIYHDNNRKIAGKLTLQTGLNSGKNYFHNITQGLFQDTLVEKLNINRINMGYSYDAAIRITNSTIINFLSEYWVLPEKKSFEVQTSRLFSFFAIDSSYKNFRQSSKFKISEAKNQLSFLKKWKVFISEFIYSHSYISFSNGNNNFASKTSNEVSLLSSKREVMFNSHAFTNTGTYEFSQRFNTYYNAGIVLGKLIDYNKIQNELLWKFKYGLQWKPKIFAGLNLFFTAIKELPDIQLFYTSNLISGNAVILSGSPIVRPVESLAADISYSTFRLISKFSLLAGLKIQYDKSVYASSIFWRPEFSNTTLVLVHGNRHVSSNLNVGSFIFPLNTFLKLNTSFTYSTNQQILNGRLATNRNTFSNLNFTVVPSFSVPLITELSTGINYAKNAQFFGNIIINENDNTVMIVSLNIRSKFKSKYYVGTKYNFSKLSPNKQFQLWSIFQNYKFSKNLNCSLVIHNVLNTARFGERVITSNTISENYFNGIGRYYLFQANLSF